MKKFKQIAEQHREKGRFKPTIPRMVSNKTGASPRPTSDSADVSLRERCWPGYKPTPGKKAYAKGSCVKEEMGGKQEMQVQGTAAMTLTNKPNKEPMKTYKDLKQITELSADLLHRYKEKATADALAADKAGNFKRGDKRFSGVVKATHKQFDKFKKKGFSEGTEMNEAKDDKREYDYEGEMVKSDLRSIIANANRLIDMLEDDDNLPEWCQNKVTLAEDYISTVSNYMTAEMNEEVEQLDEKNVPTNPGLWSRAKALARSKFDVYPSAYANGWASKWYKSKGGGWKSVSEEVEQINELTDDQIKKLNKDAAEHQSKVMNKPQEKKKPEGFMQKVGRKIIGGVAGGIKGAAKGFSEESEQIVEQKETPPFEGGTKPKQKVVPGKHGKGYSTARHLARMAMQKQVQGMKKMPVKEETRKAAIVKEVMKKKNNSDDAFQKDPELSTTLTKV